MGGCRCSYRSCSFATNGKTHFFHYPVRDEVRCLKWIANAKRPDFHNLTNSQLKNKVVCEYHFLNSMFMNYKHDRLIHTAIPTVDNNDDSKNELLPNVSHYKQIDLDTEPSDTFLSTDVAPTDKEASTMTVNVSPITGYSFIPPHEKRSKNTAPYIELLTRQHNNHHLLKPRLALNPKPLSNKSYRSGMTESIVQCNENKTISQQPMNHYNIETKEIREATTAISNNVVITDLFKTPPKSIPNSYQNNDKLKIVEIPRKKLHLEEHNMNEIEQSEPKVVMNNTRKIDTLCDPSNRKRNIIVENEPILFVDPNVSLLIVQDKNPKPVTKDATVISDPVRAIHQQLMKYSQHNSFQMNSMTAVKRISRDKSPSAIIEVEPLQRVPQTRAEEEIMTKNDYLTLIQKNSKEISELKQILLRQQTGKKFSNLRRNSAQKPLRPRRLSKAGLYAHIVPFLSPELARMVHSEMFPSTIRYKT